MSFLDIYYLFFSQNEAYLEVTQFLIPLNRFAEFKLLPRANVDNKFW